MACCRDSNCRAALRVGRRYRTGDLCNQRAVLEHIDAASNDRKHIRIINAELEWREDHAIIRDSVG